jgi:hypothetical protein
MLPSREQDYSDPYFRSVFPKAVRLMRESDILVLVGYSLSEDDALIRFILRQFAEDGEDAVGKHVFYIDINAREHQRRLLSRHSLLGQRMRLALLVAGVDGRVEGLVERVDILEGLVGEMVGLEVAPDRFDVVEFGRVFRQPLDGEPMRAGGQGGPRQLAGMDRAVVLDQHDGLGWLARLGAVGLIKLLEVSDEVAAALGRARVHDQVSGDVIQ